MFLSAGNSVKIQRGAGAPVVCTTLVGAPVVCTTFVGAPVVPTTLVKTSLKLDNQSVKWRALPVKLTPLILNIADQPGTGQKQEHVPCSECHEHFDFTLSH